MACLKYSAKHLGRRGQQGHMMLGILVLAFVASLISFTAFNNSKAVNDKVQIVNAADAAAYSGAVWAARNLNFMAYTNRAIYLNHAVVGHLVSYMSWLRFYAQLSNNASTIMAFIPYLGQVVVKLNEILQKGLSVSEKVSAPFIVEAVTAINNIYFTTQNLSRLNGVYTLHQIMDKTATAHHPQIRLNHPGDLAALTKDLVSVGGYNDLINIKNANINGMRDAAQMYYKYYTFTSQFTPARDIEFNRKKRSMLMTEKTIFGMRVNNYTTSFGMEQKRWFSDRFWNVKLGRFEIFRKQGSTQLFYNEGKVDWFASDFMDKFFLFSLKKPKRLFHGQASASEFSHGKKYLGFPGYQELSRDDSKDQTLTFTALTSKPFTPLLAMSAINPDKESQRLTAISRAEVFYRRPLSDRSFLRGFRKSPYKEYSNLFNPFWQARLI